MLTSQDDLDCVQVVLAVDLPIENVAWLCPPAGAEHWSRGTGLSRKPVAAIWRSTRAPLWNHRIRRPLLIWDERSISDESGGVANHALSALRDGDAGTFRLPEPAPGEMAFRLEAELAVSLRALESSTAAYEHSRFSPGGLEPVADVLWRASAGYLEVLRAVR